MKYINEQILGLSTEDFLFFKGRTVRVTLKNGKCYEGIINNLVEASLSRPSNLIVAIVLNEKTIDISQMSILELIS